jgi:hypothetical protein
MLAIPLGEIIVSVEIVPVGAKSCRSPSVQLISATPDGDVPLEPFEISLWNSSCFSP